MLQRAGGAVLQLPDRKDDTCVLAPAVKNLRHRSEVLHGAAELCQHDIGQDEASAQPRDSRKYVFAIPDWLGCFYGALQNGRTCDARSHGHAHSEQTSTQVVGHACDRADRR